MRRFLTTSFIALALVVGAAGVAPAAHAEANKNGENCFVNADCVSNYCSPEGIDRYTCKANAAASSGNTYAPDAASAKQPADYKTDAASQLGTVMTWIMSLFAWLLGVAALTLNYAVLYTVVTMGDYVNNLSAVGVTWRILRDLGNIIIIFGFLAIGITTILNVNWYGGKMKMLPMLLVSAVFLNFSLFITEAVIDTGNLFATQFYTQINGGVSPTREALSGVTVGTFGSGSIGNEAISNAIMGQLGLQTIYGKVRTDPKIFEGANTWLIGFMGTILFIIAAFVMFSLAFILIARFVILLFLIIISPVAFAGLAIPQLASSAKKWWDMLFQQTITAPVLLLLLYIALTVITDVNFLTGSCGKGTCTKDWTGFVSGNDLSGFGGMVLSFLVAMGLLLAVTIFSKKLSAFGGAGATKLAGKLSGMSIAAAAPGWVGRHTVGLGANYAAKKLRDTGFGRSFVGRGIAGTLEKRVAGASFDVRNTELGKSATGAGLILGKGQTGGYKADLEERVKSYEAAAAGIIGVNEKGEKMAAKKAKEELETSGNELNKAKAGHSIVSDENQRLKAERDRLQALDTANKNARTPNFKVSQDLRDANQKLSDHTSKDLADAAKALQAATADLNRKRDEEKVARENVGASKKKAQAEYADRLENRWGIIPIFGTAAAAAAPRVRADIGKTGDQRAIEKLLKDIKDKAGAAAPIAAPTTTPPAGGGTPNP